MSARVRRGLCGAGLLGLLAGALPPGWAAAAPPGPPCPCARPGYALAFADEFDTLALQVDGGPGVWSTTGDGSNAFRIDNRTLPHERELYTDRAAMEALALPPANDPFKVERGVLSITAAPLPPAARTATGLDYSSGLLVTRRSRLFHFAYVEVRARIPSGRGLWPAIWLFRPGPVYGEIDVMENLGQEPGTVYATVHYRVEAAGGPRVDQVVAAKREGPSLADGFHVYAVDWAPDGIRFFLDGRETGRTPMQPALDAPMYLLLNLAVGGEGSWPGPVGPDTRFPAAFEVDYARVWTMGGASSR